MEILVKNQKKIIKIFLFTVKTIPVCVSYNQYGPYLCDHNIIKVVAVSDPECGEVLMVSRDIVINRPPVIVKVKNFNYGIGDLRNRETLTGHFLGTMPINLKHFFFSLILARSV